DFVANEVTENRRMPDVRANRAPQRIDNGIPGGSLSEKLDVFRPRNSDQDTHVRVCAPIQEPARWRVIDPQKVDSKFTHQLEVALELRWRPQIMPFGIRPERPV